LVDFLVFEHHKVVQITHYVERVFRGGGQFWLLGSVSPPYLDRFLLLLDPVGLRHNDRFSAVICVVYEVVLVYVVDKSRNQ